MADLLKQLVMADVTDTATTVYTVPADTVTSVVHVIAVNTSASSRTLSVVVGGKHIAHEEPIAANEPWQFKGTVVLNAADTISVVADAAGVELIASGVEVTDQPGNEGGGGSGVSDVLTVNNGINFIRWTNQPAALTEFVGVDRVREWVDLTNVSEARLVIRLLTAGASGAEWRAQYSTDESAWAYLDGVAGPAVDISAAGSLKSAWVTLEAGAKTDVVLRYVGVDGNGVADPEVTYMALQVR